MIKFDITAVHNQLCDKWYHVYGYTIVLCKIIVIIKMVCTAAIDHGELTGLIPEYDGWIDRPYDNPLIPGPVVLVIIRSLYIIRARNMRVSYSDRFVCLSVRPCIRPVRKKWLSLFYSSYVWYMHKLYTKCSSWHYLLMSCSGLCPWPTFHAWVTMVRKKWS